VTYTTDASDVDASTLAANLNRFAAANKLAVTAAVEGGDVVIRADAYGSAIALDVTTGAGGLVASAVTPGRDVEGTINGIAATGAGQVLSTDAGNDMLALRINATDADVAAAGGGPFGTFEFRAGFAQRLGNVVSRTTDLVDGSLSTAIDGKQSQVDTFTKQIAAWDVRLALRETALRRQFTAMETALGQLRDRSNWLAGQLAGLMSGQ
jgi:flagellar hook-associated protein 2